MKAYNKELAVTVPVFVDIVMITRQLKTSSEKN